MKAIDKNTPAFPQIDSMDSAFRPGITMRDYFAAKALSAVICDWINSGDIKDGEIAEVIARDCYIVADAMLKARES